MAKDKGPQQISLEIPFRENISRLFIFRFLWGAIVVWPMMVWGLWIGLVSFIHFWFMLITGTKHKGLWERQVRFFRYVLRWNTYFHFLVDKRPEFIE